MLSLTEKGREDLLDRLRHPKQAEITDQVRFNTLLAFLRHLPDPVEQAAVLRRRLDFLTDTRELLLRGRRTRARGGDRRPVPAGHAAGGAGDREGGAGVAQGGDRTARSARLTRPSAELSPHVLPPLLGELPPAVVSRTSFIAPSTAPARFPCAPTAR